jgi:hypothetical protein
MIEIEPPQAANARTRYPLDIGLEVVVHPGPLSAAMFCSPRSRRWPARLARCVSVAIGRSARRIAPVCLDESVIAEQARGLGLLEPGAYRRRARGRMAASAE